MDARFLAYKDNNFMTSGADARTSTTLLRRLRQDPTDPSAWNEFVERYGRMIYRWCRRYHLQEADAEDVTQNVLLILAAQMKKFTYDPSKSFRGWLKTITYRTWCQFSRSRKKPGAGVGGEQDLDQLCSAQAGAEFVQLLERECDRELLEKAMSLVKLRVQPHTWEAFRLLALEGLSGIETAEQLHMNVGTVFVARSKVQRMLQQEIKILDRGEP
jgi:RNA polymerase sigma-70 factor (ECF subfamily)